MKKLLVATGIVTCLLVPGFAPGVIVGGFLAALGMAWAEVTEKERKEKEAQNETDR